MKKVLLLGLCMASLGLTAQVQINKPIQLSGSGTDAKIQGIKDVTDDDDAASKKYVDTTIAANLGGPSTLDFNFTSNVGSASVGVGNTTTIPVELYLKYVSGSPSPVTIDISGLPAGVSHELNPGGGYTSFDTELYFTASGGAVEGSYPITLTASGGSTPKTLNLTLNVIGVKRVFHTSTIYDGNLGGLSGADAKCQARADAASLGGTWKAWLSSSTVDAKDRINDGLYITVNGDPLAPNKAELLNTGSNPLDTQLYPNEFGTNGGAQNWTGTNGNGTRITNYHCNDWTSNSSGVSARAGYNIFTDGRWTSESNENCNSSYYLYCFEQ